MVTEPCLNAVLIVVSLIHTIFCGRILLLASVSKKSPVIIEVKVPASEVGLGFRSECLIQYVMLATASG